jgi:hypothetical protein
MLVIYSSDLYAGLLNVYNAIFVDKATSLEITFLVDKEVCTSKMNALLDILEDIEAVFGLKIETQLKLKV